MEKKRAKFAVSPPIRKQAQITRTPGTEARERISWRMGNADLNGAFSWANITEAELMNVWRVLRETDKQHWEAMAGDGTGQIKSIPVGGLSRDARDRLQRIKRDDEDFLHEIRFGGQPRLWGIRRDSVFHILWWDPRHEVCPASLRNT